MSLLLTVYDTPVWKKIIDASGLPSINESTPVVHTTSAALQSPQPILTISALLLGLSAGEALWVGVVQAEYYLANAIENGTPLADAAKAWHQQTNILLSIQRQNRKELKLFNVHQALAQPEAFRQCLNKFPIAKFNAEPIINNLPLLIACQYLSQQPGLRELNTRLQASVLPLCDDEKLVLNLDQILLQNQSNNNTSAERSLLLSQLSQTQMALEAVNVERSELIRKLEKTSTDLSATREERDLILAQLKLVQEQLEQYYVSLQKEQQNNKHALLARDKQHAKEIAKLESEIRKTKARAANAEFSAQLSKSELKKLRTSISWKAGTPVRVLGRMIRKNDPDREKLLQDIGLVLTSEYFDVDWYLRAYPDIAESQMNPAEHYLLHGAAEGRLPGPLFDGNWYLQNYPDVAEANINPLLHFIMYGQQEGRSSSPIMLTNGQNSEE